MKKLNATFSAVMHNANAGIKKFHLLKKIICGIFLTLINYNVANAQLTLTGQLRTRSEFRDGQGTLLQNGSTPAAFTSQRTRLNVGYTGYRFKLFTAIQDVRVWGQDASTINSTTTQTNNGLMLHEAWGKLCSTIQVLCLKLKIFPLR